MQFPSLKSWIFSSANIGSPYHAKFYIRWMLKPFSPIQDALSCFRIFITEPAFCNRKKGQRLHAGSVLVIQNLWFHIFASQHQFLGFREYYGDSNNDEYNNHLLHILQVLFYIVFLCFSFCSFCFVSCFSNFIKSSRASSNYCLSIPVSCIDWTNEVQMNFLLHLHWKIFI